ncbi:MAG TPA: hypothetical protein VFG25_06060 [Nitrosopumilaceae archaeon]|nr:hypothetical protein [Nitrosopumilaceae archaeon]
MEITRNSILVGIGAILVLGLVGTPMIQAEEQNNSLFHELKQIEIQIHELKENSNDFDIEKLGSNVFELRTIGDSILDVQKLTYVENDIAVSKVIDYLIDDYQKLYEAYFEKVSDYKKHNPVSSSERFIINELVKNELNFVTHHEYQNNKELEKQFMKSEVQRLQHESEFQNLINKIGIKLADEANGNKIEKTQHKIALENIIISADWELAPDALDRIITQLSDDDLKNQLNQNKEKILDLIKQLDEAESQKPQLYALTSGYAYVFFGDILNNENKIHTPHILASQIKNEIYSLAEQSYSIIEEDEKRQHETFLAQIIDSQSAKSEVEPEPEPDTKPEHTGNGNGNNKGNDNDNGSDNGNGNNKGNDNDKGDNGDNNDEGNSDEKENGKGNGKAKGKKA